MKEIPLTRGLVALVDDRDYATLMRLAPWHVLKGPRTFYASHNYPMGQGRGRPTGSITMHVALMGKRRGVDIDHIDGNGLNNQRSNLRWATRSQNRANARKPRNSAARFKGVSFIKRLGKFQASIGKPKRYLGVFTSEEDAARAYDAAANTLYGEFARPNFPQVLEDQ